MRGGASPEEAWSKEFGTELPAIEKALREYVSLRTFPAVTYTFDTTTRAAGEAKAEKVGEAEASGYLGDLLGHGERTEEARAYLKKVITSDPDAARALYALGLLELRGSQIDEAVRLLERASTLRPGESAFLTAYGRALINRLRSAGLDDAQRESTFERARSVLSRSVELDPHAAYALATLGYLELVGGEPARAVDLLKRAVAVAPSDESYLMMLGDALAVQGNYNEATTVFSALLARAAVRMFASRRGTALDASRSSACWRPRARRPPLPVRL